MKFYAFIVGGEGPDVWDRDVEVDAVDIADAVNLANGRAEDLGGTVVSIDQTARPEPRPLPLYGTASAGCGTPHCCGCLSLAWVPDEEAYRGQCNECGKLLGWFKSDWSNDEDRDRLGCDKDEGTMDLIPAGPLDNAFAKPNSPLAGKEPEFRGLVKPVFMWMYDNGLTEILLTRKGAMLNIKLRN